MVFKNELKTYKTNALVSDAGERVITRKSKVCPHCNEEFFYENQAFTLTMPYKQCVHCKQLVDIPNLNEWFLMTIGQKISLSIKLCFVAICFSIVPIMLYVMGHLLIVGEGPEPNGLVIVVSFLLGVLFATGTIRQSKKRSKNKAYLKELYRSGLCDEDVLKHLLVGLE